MKFEVKGEFNAQKVKQKFVKELEAKNESHAKHKAYSFFGSKHNLLRRQIKIESVSPKKEEAKK
jgi:ribosomal protein L20A (L18A)